VVTLRYFYLDNLRAVLMVLGLVLHTCAAFSPSKYWLVSYLQPLHWVDSINDFIHLFRMPLFFMISGFFAYTMMEKQSLKIFCSTKVLRIGLPFLTVLLIINLPQYIVLDNLRAGVISQQINTNSLVGHLWFLVNLLVYFLLYSYTHAYINKLLVYFKKLTPITYITLVILVLPLSYLGLLAANKISIPIYAEFLIIGSIYKLFAYIDYFFIGALFAGLGHEYFIKALKSSKGVFLLFALLIVSSLPWWFSFVINDVTTPYIAHIQAIFISLLIWLIGAKSMNSNTGTFNQLANASYSIYLFHHGIIIALVLTANLLISKYNFDINSNIVFFSIIAITLLFTKYFHTAVIDKSRLLSLIFNGKGLTKV
jgi:glucan biosynthesis protein C